MKVDSNVARQVYEQESYRKGQMDLLTDILDTIEAGVCDHCEHQHEVADCFKYCHKENWEFNALVGILKEKREMLNE